MPHIERHRTAHIGWLRASVLGANDGLISTSSLVVGVASAQATHASVLLTAFAGLVAGALSMAAGEYVSVSSQADTEQFDLNRERGELATQPDVEHAELAAIYVGRGISPELATEVATQLMAHDALSAHARDELGISELTLARPLQAALASAASFAAGAALPLVVVLLSSGSMIVPATIAGSLLLLAVLGATAARLGGAPLLRGAVRVTFWGAVAMGTTALVGHFFGTAV
ncbi:MAG: VIT family protein [Gemmatimonadales bacterium]